MLNKDRPFIEALIPILIFLTVMILGLVVMPLTLDSSLSIELAFAIAALLSGLYLNFIGYKWQTISDSIVNKMKQAITPFTILLAIGMLIGSWIFSGTIPHMIYIGAKIIDPQYLYVITLLVCILGSLFTGTSWGTIASFGVVTFSIAVVADANLALTAAAIVGGSYFGDKMSPLSDTTNIAAMAAKVDLYDHIKSMAYTTLPAVIAAAAIYYFIGMSGDFESSAQNDQNIADLKTALDSVYNFGFWTIIPLIFVIGGSVLRLPTAPTLVGSAILSLIVGTISQDFGFAVGAKALVHGLDFGMAGIDPSTFPDSVRGIMESLLHRGGVYSMAGATIAAFFVFVFIGTIDTNETINRVVDKSMSGIKSAPALITTTLIATGITNAGTSNQMATSFIIGNAFGKRYDDLNVSRRVLSRSIEDTGTMLECILPWTVTGLYIAQILELNKYDMSVWSYMPFQFVSLIGIALAFFYAITGIACFKRKN